MNQPHSTQPELTESPHETESLSWLDQITRLEVTDGTTVQRRVCVLCPLKTEVCVTQKD